MKAALRVLLGIGRGMSAFFRAYDHPVRVSESGFPLLEGWGKLEDQDIPYHALLRGLGPSPTTAPAGALIFTQGKDKGEVVYLHPGEYTLGTGCTHSIVVTTSVLTERSLKLHVSLKGVLASSDAFDCPLMVNGNRVTEALLIDQDECSFGDAVFYYQEMRR